MRYGALQFIVVLCACAWCTPPCHALAHVGQRPPLPRVVYENSRLLVVAKPFGMQYHAVNCAEDGEEGLITSLRAMQRSGALGYRGNLHTVHRLDAVTSG